MQGTRHASNRADRTNLDIAANQVAVMVLLARPSPLIWFLDDRCDACDRKYCSGGRNILPLFFYLAAGCPGMLCWGKTGRDDWQTL